VNVPHALPTRHKGAGRGTRPVVFLFGCWRLRMPSYIGLVTIGKSSVLNGEAGRPSLLNRFTTGQFDQP